jgi:hypothetical protein
MAMVGAIRRLLALPLLLLGRLFALISPPSCVGLYMAAWTVSGDGQIAVLTLQAMSAHLGAEAAEAAAAAWMARRPRPDIAAFAGLLALHRDDAESAAHWLVRGRQAGQDALGNLDLLEYLLAAHDRPGARTELARQLAHRRDLSPALARLTHEELLWDDMFSRNFAAAYHRARRLLEIEDLLPAAAAMWALAERSGRADLAGEYHAQLATAPPAPRLYWQCLGSFAVGHEQRGRELLHELAETSESLAVSAAHLLRGKGAAI